MRVPTRQVGNKKGVRPWPCPLQNRLNWGHFTRFSGRDNYPQRRGTRPNSLTKAPLKPMISLTPLARRAKRRMVGRGPWDAGSRRPNGGRLYTDSASNYRPLSDLGHITSCLFQLVGSLRPGYAASFSPSFFHSNGERTLATESLNRTAGLRCWYAVASNSVQCTRSRAKSCSSSCASRWL